MALSSAESSQTLHKAFIRLHHSKLRAMASCSPYRFNEKLAWTLRRCSLAHLLLSGVAAKAMLLSDGDLHRVPFVWEPWRGEAAEVLAAVTKFLVLDADHHGQATLLWPALLLSAFPEFRHANTRLDLMLVSLVMLCRRNRSSGLAVHDFIEYSAGSCELTMQCLLKDLAGVALDKCLKVEHDNATANGLRLWIMELTKTKPGALTWFGTQCSSFTSL